MKKPATRVSRKRTRMHPDEAWACAILQNADQGILAVDRDGRIVTANPAAERMYGYGAGEMLQLPLESLMPARHRERHAAHFKQWFSKPRARPMTAGVELSCLRKDGVEFAAEASLSYIDEPDGVLGVAFVSDVTGRQQSERMLADYRKRLQKLTTGLMAAQKTGNRELARELHDVFSQELAGVGMEISLLKEAAGSDSKLAEHLSELGERVSRVAKDLHRSAREIHPAILKKGGLGLISMQERVRAMNGELTINSKPGVGTVVTAFVPLSEGREQCTAPS
jgi:PAS domain S-box-containing protein